MSALNVTIDPSIKGAWPEARLGCFIYTADVRAREDSLWTCLENEVAPYLKTMLETTPLAQIPNLDESRKAYKAFGKDPGRFRVSSESLYRRVRQGKALYQINSVVDANNLVSLETGFSLGSYVRPASVRTSFSVWARPGRCIRASARTTSRSKTCPCSQTGKARSEAPPATLPAP